MWRIKNKFKVLQGFITKRSLVFSKIAMPFLGRDVGADYDLRELDKHALKDGFDFHL